MQRFRETDGWVRSKKLKFLLHDPQTDDILRESLSV
jgi:hypothetical protein